MKLLSCLWLVVPLLACQIKTEPEGVPVGITAASESKTAWFDIAEKLAGIPYDYEVEVFWVPIAIPEDFPENRERLNGAAAKLEQVLLGQGEVDPNFESLERAVLELWAAQDGDSRTAKTAKYRITRGRERVLQYGLSYPTVHTLHTPDLTLMHSSPPGALSISDLDKRVQPYVPQTILKPLPSGEAIGMLKSMEWKSVGDRMLRADRDSQTGYTVQTDGKGRPIAFWSRFTQASEQVYAGFYAWSQTEGEPAFPTGAIILRGEGRGMHVMMYQVRGLSLDASGPEPVMVLGEVSGVVDLRGNARKTMALPLPDFLTGLVRIEGE